MEENLDFLFNNVSLYTKKVFKVFNLENDLYTINDCELEKFFTFIGINQERLIAYCNLCKKEFPFTIDREIFFYNSCDVLSTTNKLIIAYQPNVFNSSINLNSKSIGGIQPPYKKDNLLNNRIWYMLFNFNCTNNSKHHYSMMLSIELKNGNLIVRKIGQNPSIQDIKGFDFDKYKKHLKQLNAYEDYKKADLSYTEHFYVGAFAYLRRIFEKMVNSYLVNKQLEDNHMDTKMKACKDSFDPRIQNLLKNLYSILSISIHELDEEESKDYYIYLKAVIDIQLEYLKTEYDKKQQTNQLSSTLNAIATNLGKD